MPAWPAQQRDDEVWAVVAFLRRFPKLGAAEYEELAFAADAGARGGAPIEDLDESPDVPRAIAESCSQCHGADGLGRGEGAFPRLAGQRPLYLDASLQAYASGERHSGIMEPIAAGLDREESRALALYYARREHRSAPVGSGEAAGQLELGARIARNGLPDQLVPACVECHGPVARRRNPHYPSLAGQYADYLTLQLTLLKEARRGGTPYAHIMRQVAGGLTEAQIRAVALYFASLPWDAADMPVP
jgi:cytochrome c553